MISKDILKNPAYAAAFAGCVTAAAIKFTGTGEKKNSDIIKPSVFVALLVYFIMYQGNKEPIIKEPF